MKFSNFLFPQAETPERDEQVIDETLAEARLCDKLGMETLWLAEHHFDGNCAYVDPVSFAAALAVATKQIKIGFAVAQMSLHHPIRMAEQMAMVDNLSKGRLIVGLGRAPPGYACACGRGARAAPRTGGCRSVRPPRPYRQ